MSELPVSVISDDEAVTVIGKGTFDLTNCCEFSEAIKQAAETADLVTVDLTEVDFIDSHVLQDMATAAVALIKKGKRLRVLVDEEKYPVRVILTSKFDQIMDVISEK